jgi:hypothetical protein
VRKHPSGNPQTPYHKPERDKEGPMNKYRSIAKHLLTRIKDERPSNVDRWMADRLQDFGRVHRARIEIQMRFLLQGGGS